MIVSGPALAVTLLLPLHLTPVEQVVPEPWGTLAACESDRTWDITPGQGNGIHSGGLQFLPDTWDAFAPDRFPDHAYEASPRQQVVVAERVLDVQGWDAWPACSRKLGLR